MSKRILLISAYNKTNGCTVDVETCLYKETRMSGNISGYPAPPLGLYRIKGFLKHSVEVFDPILSDPYKFLEDSASEFDVIGFSPSHLTLEHDLSLMWYAHEKNPQAVLVAGGEEATFNSSQIAEHSPLDYIIFGEGEHPLAEIVNAGLLKSSGRCYIGNQKPLREKEFYDLTVKMNFNAIPYEKYWEMIEKVNPNKLKARTVRLYTSSYCPNGCAFCSSTNFLKFSYGEKPLFAMIPSEGLLTMVLRIVSVYPSVQTIFFQDDNFIQGKRGRERMSEFCKKVVGYKRKQVLPRSLSFMCQTRISDVSEKLLRLMALAGFRMVSYGVESFSERILEEYQKGITVNQINRALEWTYQARMTPFINIILSSPECSLSDIQLTVDKCIEHISKGAEVGITLYLMPFVGASIFRKPGLLIQTEKVRIPRTDFSFDKKIRVSPFDAGVRILLEKVSQVIRQRGYLDSAARSEFYLKTLSLFLEGRVQ